MEIDIHPKQHTRPKSEDEKTGRGWKRPKKIVLNEVIAVGGVGEGREPRAESENGKKLRRVQSKGTIPTHPDRYICDRNRGELLHHS